MDDALQLTSDELELFLSATDDAAVARPQSSDEDSGEAATTGKRSRRTEIERLSRRRRQAALRAMRDEVKTLEKQFSTLMAGHARQRGGDERLARPKAPETLDAQHDTVVVRGDVLKLRERFIELTLEIQQLECEQKEIRQMLRAKHLLAFSLRSLASSCVDDWDDGIPIPMLDLEYHPLKAEEYFSIMRDAYKEMLSYEAMLARDRSEATCMGWLNKQFVKGEHALTSLTKTLRGRQAEELMRESWDLYSSEARMRQVFGDWSNGIRCRLLYKLNEDVLVFYRTFERRHVEKRFHSIVLLYRVQTEDGFVVGTRTIPTPALQDMLKLPDKWTDIRLWVIFKQIKAASGRDTDSGVEVVFGVAHGTPLPVPLSNLCMNFFTSVLRWEGSIATPMTLKWS